MHPSLEVMYNRTKLRMWMNLLTATLCIAGLFHQYWLWATDAFPPSMLFCIMYVLGFLYCIWAAFRCIRRAQVLKAGSAALEEGTKESRIIKVHKGPLGQAIISIEGSGDMKCYDLLAATPIAESFRGNDQDGSVTAIIYFDGQTRQPKALEYEERVAALQRR